MHIEGYRRDKKGKNYARRLRKEGLIPAVIYSKRINSIPIILKEKEILAIEENMRIEVRINSDGGTEVYQAILKEKSYSPIKARLLHVDLQEILIGEEISTILKLKLEGKAKGEEEGGVVELQISEIEVKGKVEDIPLFLEIDITPLSVNDAFTVKDLKERYPKLSILEEDSTPLVIIVPLKKGEEEEKLEEEKKEPEVIAKGKKKEEEGGEVKE